MAATVIVLGAGASRCEGVSRHPKRGASTIPPLDLDFFERATAANREPSLVESIRTHASRVGHPDPFQTSSATSLEHYLGILFYGLLRTPQRADLQAYYDLIRLYNRELLATTNWLVGRKQGAIERLMRKELDRKPDRLDVVTFNHDLLAENALASLPHRKYGHCWCHEHGYSLAQDSFQRLNAASRLVRWDACPGDHPGLVKIHKLHGSLNWVFRTAERNPSVNLARQAKPIFVHNIQKPIADYRVRPRGARRSFYLWPVIVPPIYDKQSFILQHLSAVWDAAYDALASADRVIFFGYSFPAADYHARFFFEQAAIVNEALRRPIVINPDFGVATTCWQVLHTTSVTVFRSLDDYASVD